MYTVRVLVFATDDLSRDPLSGSSIGIGGSFRLVSGLRQRCCFRQGGITVVLLWRLTPQGMWYLRVRHRPPTSVSICTTCWHAAASADDDFSRLGVGCDRSELLVCVLERL